MNKVPEITAKALNEFRGKKLAVGVSGGRDSTCLLYALLECGEVKASDIVAVHVNHGLRPTANRDEEFVKSLCERLGVKFMPYRIDVNARAAHDRIGIEQAAREMRYDIFFNLVKTGAADIILTAHHALDNAESILMHMFRGAGLDGLTGMESYSQATRILRPFLGVTPDMLDGYVAEKSIEYVVDETNFDDGADRNFFRLRVLPLIEERYKGAARAVNALSVECADAVRVLDGLTDDARIGYDCGAVVLSDSELTGALAARYVRKALARFTLTDMSRAQINAVIDLKNARTGAVAELSHGVRAAREYGTVAIYLPREKCTDEKRLALGDIYIDGLLVSVKPTQADARQAAGKVCDGDKLAGATVRFRRDGDVFVPFGGGRKKLKEYFIDKKIPSRLRDRIPLVCKGNNVLAVIGVEISEEVKVTAETRNKVEISLRR